jgi:hypothetical protein
MLKMLLDRLRAKIALLLLSLPLGCAGSFEEARLAGAIQSKLGAPSERNQTRCESLDSRAGTWGAVAKGAAILASASGLTTVPVRDPDARSALVAGSVTAAAVAAGSFAVAERAATAWAQECGQ